MPLIFIAAILVIVGIDLLLSWNDFSGFFKILGIELLVAVVVWILKLIFSKSKTSDDSVDSERYKDLPLDGITCQLLADDLNRSLAGSRIDKIFMPDRHSVVLHIRTNNGIRKLLICADPGLPRVMITEDVKDNPALPPSFCMLLRKYIAGARISSISNPGYERVIEISCTNTDELRDVKDYRLIVELMGRFSNIILVNGSGKILDSSVHVDFDVSRLREVMPARIYSYPPLQNKIPRTKLLKSKEHVPCY